MMMPKNTVRVCPLLAVGILAGIFLRVDQTEVRDAPNPNVRQLVATAKPASDGSGRLQARFARG